ncbi:MAG: SDR family oxidoreductase [Myxococcota bacterium]|nr:SDR family oxidoreductase [Myxococcota bacterium]
MILYNGSTGSLGKYLQPSLKNMGLKGASLTTRLENHATLAIELESILGLDAREDPIVLVQLAAMVSVPKCESNPERAFQTNVTDTINYVRVFFDWCRDKGHVPELVYVSSGHVYAAQSEGQRLTEQSPVSPRSVYATTKLEAEEKLSRLCTEMGVPIKVLRVFGLIAPVQPINYVLPGLIQRVTENKLTSVPGLDHVRDYLDVRDVCDYILKFCFLHSDTLVLLANICSGKPTKIRDIIVEIVDNLSLTTEKKGLLLSGLHAAPGRPDDIPWIVGDPTLMNNIIGHKKDPISLKRTVADALQQQPGFF